MADPVGQAAEKSFVSAGGTAGGATFLSRRTTMSGHPGYDASSPWTTRRSPPWETNPSRCA